MVKEHFTHMATVFPRFSAPAQVSVPARFSAPIKVQMSISTPPQVSARHLDKCPPSHQLDFDEISKPLGWRVRNTFESTTLLKMFTLFYCGIRFIYFFYTKVKHDNKLSWYLQCLVLQFSRVTHNLLSMIHLLFRKKYNDVTMKSKFVMLLLF